MARPLRSALVAGSAVAVVLVLAPSTQAHSAPAVGAASANAPAPTSTSISSRVALERNAVVSVKPVKRKKRTVYRVSISNHIGRVYMKWTMAVGGWRYEDWQIDGRASYIAPARLRTLKVRAPGYKTVKLRLKKPAKTFRLVTTGKPLPWEVEGSPSSYSFIEDRNVPYRWDPCTYTYSRSSWYSTITGSALTRRTLTWSLDSGAFAQPLLEEAFAKISADSGWTFRQVTTGANIPVTVKWHSDSRSVRGSAPIRWDDPGVISSGAIEAEIGRLTPTGQRVRMFMHEIAHVLGLGHVDDESQLMNPEIIWAAKAKTGAGDRAGLAHLSPDRGCVRQIGEWVYLP